MRLNLVYGLMLAFLSVSCSRDDKKRVVHEELAENITKPAENTATKDKSSEIPALKPVGGTTATGTPVSNPVVNPTPQPLDCNLGTKDFSGTSVLKFDARCPVYTFQKINVLSGKLTIESGVKLEALSKESSIVVSDNAVLTVGVDGNKTTVLSASTENGWSGVVAGKNSAIHLDNAVIERSGSALDASHGAAVSLKNAVFLDNTIGLWCEFCFIQAFDNVTFKKNHRPMVYRPDTFVPKTAPAVKMEENGFNGIELWFAGGESTNAGTVDVYLPNFGWPYSWSSGTATINVGTQHPFQQTCVVAPRWAV